MTDIASLEVLARENIGTGAARSTRREGMVPGVLYGKGVEPQNVQIEKRILVKEMYKSGFHTRLFKFKLGGKERQVLVRDVQLHPVSDMPLHVDFLEVAKDSRIHLEVPLRFLNEEKCPGIKKGGVLNQVHHALNVYCAPNNIPDHIDIDLATADIGFTLHFEDITLPEGISFVHDNPRDTVAAIVPPKVGGAQSDDEADGEAEGSEDA